MVKLKFMESFWLAFLTGLTTGGFSCLAVQGGLLASAISGKETQSKQIVGLFLIAKIIAYTFLGAGLGLVGSALTISAQTQGWMQIFAGVFMLLTAARLLDIHPIFRYFVIQPPRFVYKFLRKTSKSDAYFTPLLLGSLTVLIPCGITQGMMILAVSSGNPVTGALIMFSFILGTSPVFFALGIATSQLLKRKIFAIFTAGVIAILGAMAINSGQVLRGSIYTFQNFYKAATTDVYGSGGSVAGVNAEGKQEVTIDVLNNGYNSSSDVLKAGVPVKLSLVTNGTRSCTRAFTIPALGVSKVLPQTGSEPVDFTPTQAGSLAYSCGMGMYGGTFQVIN